MSALIVIKQGKFVSQYPILFIMIFDVTASYFSLKMPLKQLKKSITMIIIT